MQIWLFVLFSILNAERTLFLSSFLICVFQYVSQFRYLGHIIDNQLTDNEDIKREIRNLYLCALICCTGVLINVRSPLSWCCSDRTVCLYEWSDDIGGSTKVVTRTQSERSRFDLFFNLHLLLPPWGGGPIPEVLQYRANPWRSRSKLLHLLPVPKISLISMSPDRGRIRY